jgi:hypothetical protein
VIVPSVYLGGIDDHCCLEVIVRSVDLGGIDDHYCLEVIVRFVDPAAIVINFTKINRMSNHL